MGAGGTACGRCRGWPLLRPFEPPRLQAALPPWGQDGPAAADLTAYLDFYQLSSCAQGGGRSHRMGWVAVDGERIAVQAFVPAHPQGTAVVCHGYYDHAGLYGHLIEYLLSQNLAVLAFDQPGHGLSSGPVATIASFDAYQRVLVAALDACGNLPRPWHLVGQSMGASIVMEHLARHGGEDFGEILLLAPLVRPAYWPLNRIVWEVARRTISERPRTFRKNAENADFVSLLQRDPLQAKVLPVQWVTAMVEWMQRFERYPPRPQVRPKVIQGLADRTVGWRYNLRVIERLFRPQTLRLPGARHHLVNEAPGVRDAMWRWLSERCAWQAAEGGPLRLDSQRRQQKG